MCIVPGPPRPDKKVFNSCTQAKRRLCKAILTGISRVANAEASGDPIPWDETTKQWKPTVRIGAAKREEGRLVFSPRINAEDES